MGGRRVGGLGKAGPYTMVERLGRGGMGEVYLAVSRRGVKVAVKLLREAIGDDPEARLRLEREVKALRRVESPYVARVLDAELSGDRPYLVMEYVEGETLLDAVRRGGPLASGVLIELAQGLATAIAIIHAAGVVHRDVKPANVVLGPDGPVLIDFGIAQVADATRLTMTGTFLGTPGYSAPEVFAEEEVAEPSDVHSWAATVAFAATGRPTFGRGTVEAQMYAVLNGRADLAGVPGALLPLVRAALHREPDKRPTAALLSDRLSRLARATANPLSAPVAPRRRMRADSADTPAKPETPARRSSRAEDAQAKAEPSARRGRAEEARAEPAARRGRADDAQVKAEPASRRGRGDDTQARDEAPAAQGRAAARDVRPRRAREGTAEKKSVLAAEGAHAGMAAPPGSAVLIALAMLAVPCVVVSVIWPPATFAITAAFCVLARAWWSGHWLVRKRRSARVRGTLRLVSFPLALTGSALSAVVWPGLPAAAIAASAFWVTAGGQVDEGWWGQAGPMTVAGVVFGVVCGGVVGREVERVGGHVPDLRREGLRALSVLGGFVALCAAAVRVLAWVIPHAL
ncbi:serine/threonine-protein kinase [Sphaerisporangium aureirubrum]|uniref:Serine/threonine-protein kinase n=1 Tax=Sphaerisporangium aureirubrum TaxID=1544736 RepID=A0ABW1N9H1_9ACTN